MNSASQPALDTLFGLLKRDNVLEGLLPTIQAQDWLDIEAAARVQGLSLLLYQRVAEVKELVPPTVYEHLRETYLQATARNMVMLHHAQIILKALRERGLEVIVLKGLYLAESVYAGIGLRVFDDIDLLFRRADLPAALAAMRALGYELSTWYDPDEPNRDIKHIPPLLKDGAPIVELHWTILEEVGPFSIDVEGMWARSQPVEIAGVGVRGLSVEDQLLHLSLHLTYQHRLRSGLRNLYDIDVLIRQGRVDWGQLTATAHEWGAQRVVWLTLELLQGIAGTPLPSGVVAQLLPEQADPLVVEEARRQLLERGRGETALTPDLAALGEKKGVFRKVGLAIRRVFIPRRLLGREYNVNPRSLRIYPYYIRRLARLVQDYRGSAQELLRGEADAVESAQRERARGALNQWLAGK